MKRKELFPPIDPYQTGWLQVDSIHTLYWETSGNPQGIPVLFLHGGPGAGTQAAHRRFFDPKRYRIILFDQRGAGKSKPFGEIRENTTPHLIKDIEKLRQTLGVTKWHIFGGSWGSTLALAYAQDYPDKCLSLILRGICLLEPHEIDWFLYGLRAVFPDAWDDFVSLIPEAERGNLLDAYLKLIHDPNPDIAMRACVAWSQYEGACSTLLPNTHNNPMRDDGRRAYSITRLESHYFKNNLFEPADKLARNIGRIRNIPAIIIHGRYDMVCPLANAHKLHSLWPEAEYVVVPDAGHASMEPSIMRALLDATERFKDITG